MRVRSKSHTSIWRSRPEASTCTNRLGPFPAYTDTSSVPAEHLHINLHCCRTQRQGQHFVALWTELEGIMSVPGLTGKHGQTHLRTKQSGLMNLHKVGRGKESNSSARNLSRYTTVYFKKIWP